MSEVAEHDDWKPPYCANDADEVKCPKCGEDGCVRVREKEVTIRALACARWSERRRRCRTR